MKINGLDDVIMTAQKAFREKMIRVKESGGLTVDIYRRFLSMEYHLTKNVQRHFFMVAGHSQLGKKKALRKFLFDFGQEEEFHYQIALKDLENLGFEPEKLCLDITLWWVFFDSIIEERPFMRLGGTCILENISALASDVLDPLLKGATFLRPNNIRFLTIHRHVEAAPHGDQIVEALESADLDAQQQADLLEGARIATIIYLRMLDWTISGAEGV